MNANELAQEFEEYLKQIEELPWGNHQILCDQAATMLRQQADLIRNLQKSLGFKNSGYETINLTPQLELTDEEIIKVYEDMFGVASARGSAIDFAKAILLKAQVK